MTGWRPVHVGFERDGIRVGGLDLWAERWREVPVEPPLLPHPAYPEQRHRAWVYEIGDPAAPVRFAAGELSNGVWGVWVPEG